MDRFWRFADRILLHPWTSRWGGFQAILGAGALAAGLAGGSVSLVFGFSSTWAALTACGAALVASSTVATGIDRYRLRDSLRPPITTDEDLSGSYRAAIREIRQELIENRDTVDLPIKRGVNAKNAMRSETWHRYRELLLKSPNPEPYRVGNEIYQSLHRAGEEGILFRNQSLPDKSSRTRVPIRRELANKLATELDQAIRSYEEMDTH